MARRVVSKLVVCPTAWLSYTGTVAGCLRALGVDCDIVDVGGYSGYAFIVNVTRHGTDVSGPTALPTTSATSEGDFVWNEIIRGTESLGWTIEKYHDPGDCEIRGREPTVEERARMRKLYEKVRGEIDERDRPVVVWGLPVPDYGVAVGYDDDSYIATTVYGKGHLEEPIPYYRLQAPGRIQALFFREKMGRKTQVIDREAVERAVRFASMTRSDTTWIMGPAAFDAWADALPSLFGIPEYWSAYGGNSYVGECVRESRYMAGEFLKRLAGRYHGPQSKRLQQASRHYVEELTLMEEYTRIFPHEWPIPNDWQKMMKTESLGEGAEILRKLRPLEEEAIRQMREALSEWESL